MAGMGIHKAFAGPIREAHYYEPLKNARGLAKRFDEEMAKGKEDALRARATLREIERRKAALK